ncbi:unnamed protein product [Adineta steineri]|uniref:Uncharacterized protein n=1 Tax=Adineta steineri TaxID=433720 RepID=A0A814U8T4_9BILA|nr:unnamed protein product [Adineta steineri]CAF1399743.1 unnamed protein product [Adineta steineri]
MSSKTPLTQGDGYGILIGFGTIFAMGMIGMTICLHRYLGEATDSSETFSTADRKVRTGLIASSVVSSWTWAATLLHSSSVAYSYGISGAFWYASGATVQIVLFCVVAIKLKRRAPFAHTFLEVIHARYGRSAHIVFIIFCLVTNITVTSTLLTGTSAVVHSLSGMNIAAACFLLPLGTIIYTMVGGLKATFLTDYIHTVAVLIIILFFAFITYVTSPVLGSPSKVYDLLVNASQIHPVDGNAEGSYLTMQSKQGAIFFIINIIGNFGTVFLDNGYYNKAIAASPISALPGYVLGGIAWFGIPFLIATTMGLTAVALENNPIFPTYPNRLSAADVSAGLTLSTAAVALIGKSGAIATLIMIFMACTSAMSAQLIAVSSIVTYDIYKAYFNQTASGKKLIYVSHMTVVLFGLGMSIWSIALYYIEISMGYLYSMMGIIISSAVIPGALTLLWNRQSKWAVCLSPPLGFICSVSAWLVVTKIQFNSVSIETTGSDVSMLVGNVVALLSPIVFVPIISFIAPDPARYDFVSMRAIELVDDGPRNTRHPSLGETERGIVFLTGKLKFARIIAVVLTSCLVIILPFPMYGTAYVFSKSFFTGWVSIGIIWMFFSFCIVGIYPIVENQPKFSKWKQNAITVAGGNGQGQQLSQLSHPFGIFIDEKKNIFIADWWNHRIVEWKYNAKEGKIIAGGNGQGNRMDQLNYPTNMIVDQQNHSVIIADSQNRRVIQWLNQKQQILIHNIDCYGLAMDKHGFLYVSDAGKNEVRRWKIGEYNNEGIVVAGVIVDHLGQIYVADCGNDRLIRWYERKEEGGIVVGGNGHGNQSNQLNGPIDLSFDGEGNLYVADIGNHRIQKFEIIL